MTIKRKGLLSPRCPDVHAAVVATDCCHANTATSVKHGGEKPPVVSTSGDLPKYEPRVADDGVLHGACQTEIKALRAEVELLRKKLDAALGDIPACSICLECVDYPVELQECRHLFCCQCFYMYAKWKTTGNIACPACRTTVYKAPLPPPLAFIQHLDAINVAKRRQQEAVRTGADPGQSLEGGIYRIDAKAESQRRSEGESERKVGEKIKLERWKEGVSMMKSHDEEIGEDDDRSAAGLLDRAGPSGQAQEDRDMEAKKTAAATAIAARRARAAYQGQMAELKVMFEAAERMGEGAVGLNSSRRIRPRTIRNAEMDGSTHLNYDESDGVYRCLNCHWEVDEGGQCARCLHDDDDEEEDVDVAHVSRTDFYPPGQFDYDSDEDGTLDR